MPQTHENNLEKQTDSALTVSNLEYRLGSRLIIHPVSFDIPARCKVALVGLNGAGKSTLLELLANHIGPSSGEINFYTHSKRPLNEVLGVQKSAMAALKGLTVVEYLNFCCQLKLNDELRAQAAIGRVTSQWHLEEITDLRLTQLSQGNLQKVSLAQAFLLEPEFLLLDEPTQALDPIEQQRFIENLQQTSLNGCCIFSSHHINEAVAIADRVILFHHGKLVVTLNLKSKEETWFVSCLTESALNELETPSEITMIHSGARINLFKANNCLDIAKTLDAIQKLDPAAQWLGESQLALLPLFSLLANEAL